jgi:CRISPR-associated endonuclease/helicase Cas3
MFFAHTGDEERKLQPQLYTCHINGVRERSLKAFRDTFSHHPYHLFLSQCLEVAAVYHDLGKLSTKNQLVLSQLNRSEEKLENHVSSGVEFLYKKHQETKNIGFLISAWLVHAHHIGLCDENDFLSTKGSIFSVSYNIQNNIIWNVSEDILLLKEKHDKVISHQPFFTCSQKLQDITSLDLRMLLSCLTEGDHGDTSFFYGMRDFNHKEIEAEKRIVLLDRYITQLRDVAKNSGVTEERIRFRNKLYENCSTVEISKNFFLLDGPVGSGKTFSGLKLALRVIKEKKLKRLFTILPFTNIITQTVSDYRKSILETNEGSWLINEIHGKVEYERPIFRKYSSLWESNFNVSTAVQFFEALFSNHPCGLRKLHNFSNSVVILDEFHQAIPLELWKVVLIVLKEMAQKFNTHIIFSSGTPVLFWNIFDGVLDGGYIKDVVCEKDYDHFLEHDEKRLNIKKIEPFSEVEECVEFIQRETNNFNKSALIVLNTTKNAVVIADKIKQKCEGIYHLSSLLAPIDRNKILENIKKKLAKKEKIVVVATSIIECGVDLSFEVGFRELASHSSILQFGGRVNRNSNFVDSKCFVFSFAETLFSAKILSKNPSLTDDINVCLDANDNHFTPKYSTAFIKEVANKKKDKAATFVKNETERRIKTQANEFTVIESLTVPVLVNKKLAEEVKKQQRG